MNRCCRCEDFCLPFPIVKVWVKPGKDDPVGQVASLALGGLSTIAILNGLLTIVVQAANRGGQDVQPTFINPLSLLECTWPKLPSQT